MTLKRLLSALFACALLCPAMALAETTGITNRVPVIDIFDAFGTVSALMDGDAATAWYGVIDPADESSTWVILTANQTVKEIWIRNGAQQSLRSYQAAGRVSLLNVTVRYGNQQTATYRYELRDAYGVENDREWVDGYQRLLLPWAISGVSGIELRVCGVTAGSGSQEVALSDILLSSGQPSPPSSGAIMLPSAPTVRPINPTIPPLDGDSGAVSPTKPPQTQVTNTNLPTYGSGTMANLLMQIGVRSGPGTGYDYVGSFFQRGDQVEVINKVWDPSNNLFWYQVDFTSGGVRYRGYCVQENRVDLEPSQISFHSNGYSATILNTTPNYYGPGTDYKAHNDRVYATTTGTAYQYENGFVLFDWYDGRNKQWRRAWIPAENVTWEGK